MARVANTELKYFSGPSAVEERKNILARLGLGITDMGYEIIRKENNSLDENLVAVSYMDILDLLKKHPSISKVIFTSSSGRSSAARWFMDYLKSKDITHKFPTEKKPLRCEFTFDNRMISLVILYSPSRRAANRISFDALSEMYKTEMGL